MIMYLVYIFMQMPTPGMMARRRSGGGTPIADNPGTSMRMGKGPVKGFKVPRKK